MAKACDANDAARAERTWQGLGFRVTFSPYNTESDGKEHGLMKWKLGEYTDSPWYRRHKTGPWLPPTWLQASLANGHFRTVAMWHARIGDPTELGAGAPPRIWKNGMP